MNTHVGVDIVEGPTVFQTSTKTTGRNREISLMSADTQLMTDIVRDGTGIANKSIAAGAFGSVVECQIKPDGVTELSDLIKSANAPTTSGYPFAVKMMANKPKNNIVGKSMPTVTLHEFVLRDLDDIGVAQIGAVSFHNGKTDNTTTYMSMNKAQMSLQSLIGAAVKERATSNNPIFAINEYKMLTYQLIRSIAYLHSERVIHADIKPNNILVSAITNVPEFCMDFVSVNRLNPVKTFKITQLTDFGWSYGNYTSPIISRSSRYTFHQRPPEFIFGASGAFTKLAGIVDTQYITHKSDVWAMGCVLYEMATGNDFMYIKSYIRQETWATHIEMANRMIATFGKPEFEAASERLPCYDAPALNIELAKSTAKYVNPWDNPELTKYPGLKPLLRKMLVVDPRKRVNAFELLQDPFFTSPDMATIFQMATNVRPDKFGSVPYYPNSDDIQLPYVLAHMIKSLPSEYDTTHIPTKFNQKVYGHLAHQLPIIMTKLCQTTMKPWQMGESRNTLESKIMALVHIWCLKNFDDKLVLYETKNDFNGMAIAFIALALKVENEDEETVTQLMNSVVSVSNQQLVNTIEFQVLKEMDFDVFVDAPYNYINILFTNAEKLNTDVTRGCMYHAEETARNLLRLLYFNPRVVSGIASIQIIDSVFDICVRSKATPNKLHLYKSFDPKYVQLELDHETRENLIASIKVANSFIAISGPRLRDIIVDINAYGRYNVKYYK